MIRIIWDDYQVEVRWKYSRHQCLGQYSRYECRTRWGWKRIIDWCVMENADAGDYVKVWVSEDSNETGRHICLIDVYRRLKDVSD